MIPYFPQPSYHLFGPLTIHAFGTIVAVAVIVGWRMVVPGPGEGLDPELVQDLLSYVLLSGFVVAHLYSVLAYFPRRQWRPAPSPEVLEDISSFGDSPGTPRALASFPFQGAGCRRDDPVAVPGHHRVRLPFAWAIGRIACTVAHDHPGRSRPSRWGPPGLPGGAGLHRLLLPEAGRLANCAAAALARMAFHMISVVPNSSTRRA